MNSALDWIEVLQKREGSRMTPVFLKNYRVHGGTIYSLGKLEEE